MASETAAKMRAAMVCLAGLLGGCSLVFSAAEPGAADGDGGAGDGSVADAADIDGGSDVDLTRVTHTIGSESSYDYPNLAEWKAGRGGDLGNRQELRVAVGSGPQLLAGSSLAGSLSMCEGVLRPQRHDATHDERMTIDLKSDVNCQIGDVFRGGDTMEVARVLQAGPRGIVEVAQLHDPRYQAPLLIDGFANTSAAHYLIVEANPSQPHKGKAGDGIVIENSSQANPLNPASHGVDIRVDFTELRGFEITNWALGAVEGASLEGVHVEANNVLLDQLLIHDDGATLVNADSDGISASRFDRNAATIDGLELTVRNSFIYNIARAGIIFQQVTGGVLRVESCTLHNCVVADATNDKYGCVAAENAATSIELINTLAFEQSATKPAFIVNALSAFTETSSNNASDDGSHPGASGATVASNVLSQATGAIDDDLHLATLPAVEPPTVGGMVLTDFSDDIDGESRGAVWSIGADQP